MVIKLNRPNRKTLNKKQPLDRKKAQEILTNLEILARRIGTHVKVEDRPLQIELSGGLAIPLTISEEPKIANYLRLPLDQRAIYRDHKALHLSMYAPELIRLENLFTNTINRQAKYILVTHPFSANLNPLHADMPWIDWKIDKYEKVSAKQAVEERVHNLRFVEVNSAGDIITPHRTRLSYLDVYPFQYESYKGTLLQPWHEDRFTIINTDSKQDGNSTFSASEVKVVSWDKHEIKLPVQLYSPREVNIGPCKIRVVGLPWVRLVKETRKKQDDVDRYDIDLINQYLKLKGI